MKVYEESTSICKAKLSAWIYQIPKTIPQALKKRENKATEILN